MMADTNGVRTPKACRMCAKAKVRCEWDNDGSCKRCHRLGKECGGQAPGAHRRRKPAKSNVEVSALEAKFDRMVALLASSNPSVTSEFGLSARKSPSTRSDGDEGNQDQSEGECLLGLFNARMVYLFPFVVFPAQFTADELRRERPFLFLSLSMVACQDVSRQREIAGIVKEYIAEHIILRSERSLDLLQGLLVVLAWFIGHSPVRGPTGDILPGMTSQQTTQGPAQLDTFLQLAIAQLTSLRLAYGLNSPHKLSKPISYVWKMDALTDSKRLHTLEERRAYLGCYYLTVMLSSCVRDMEPLRFTNYTDECCTIIEKESEFPTDTLLAQLVRSMHLADRIVHRTGLDDINDLGQVSVPLGLSIRGFEPELRKLRISFSTSDPLFSCISLFHCDTLEILLNQVALSEDISDAQCGGYTITRLDMLFRCLQATKSFFNNFYSLSFHYFPFLPFTFWCQFGYAVVALSRLSLFRRDNGWDLEYVQTEIDFNQTIDRLMNKFEEARQFIEQASGPRSLAELPEVFGRLYHRMRLMKDSHRQKKDAMEKSQPRAVLDPLDFDFLFNMSFDTYFPFDDFMALDDGTEIQVPPDY